MTGTFRQRLRRVEPAVSYNADIEVIESEVVSAPTPDRVSGIQTGPGGFLYITAAALCATIGEPVDAVAPAVQVNLDGEAVLKAYDEGEDPLFDFSTVNDEGSLEAISADDYAGWTLVVTAPTHSSGWDNTGTQHPDGIARPGLGALTGNTIGPGFPWVVAVDEGTHDVELVWRSGDGGGLAIACRRLHVRASG